MRDIYLQYSMYICFNFYNLDVSVFSSIIYSIFVMIVHAIIHSLVYILKLNFKFIY